MSEELEEKVEEFVKKTKVEITKHLAKDKIFLSGIALLLIGLAPFVSEIQSILPEEYAKYFAAIIPSVIVVAKVWIQFFPAKDTTGIVIEPPTVDNEQ